MEKQVLVIVEGPQGVGKSTLTNHIREKLGYSTLVRETGPKINTPESAYAYHLSVLNMIWEQREMQLNIVLDRSHTTEMAYCEAGIKTHDFQEEFIALTHMYNMISKYYDVHFILLTADEEAFKVRLNRDKADYLNAKFDVLSSLNQCEAYKRVFDSVKKYCKAAKFHYIDTSDKSIEEVLEETLLMIKEDTK